MLSAVETISDGPERTSVPASTSASILTPMASCVARMWDPPRPMAALTASEPQVTDSAIPLAFLSASAARMARASARPIWTQASGPEMASTFVWRLRLNLAPEVLQHLDGY